MKHFFVLALEREAWASAKGAGYCWESQRELILGIVIVIFNAPFC
jgi:hypothetical protein